jgi:hypothetical protein
MVRALQAGFGGSLASVLPELATRHVQGIRLDATDHAPETACSLTVEVLDVGLIPLTIVHRFSQLEQLPPGTNVEWHNEPNLSRAAPPARGVIQPADYRASLNMAWAECERRGLYLWAGSFSNLNRDGQAYAAACRIDTWPAGVNVSFHRYPHEDSYLTPHVGFRNRDAEMASFKAMTGARLIACSEFGYHTGPRPRYRTIFGFRVRVGTTSWSDAYVAEAVAWEWDFWERHGCLGAVLYQLNDGLSNTAMDRYGIRRLDGSYKQVADTFQGA